MKNAGLLLTATGFILGSIGCTLDPVTINWTVFTFGLIMSIAGVVTIRISNYKDDEVAHQSDGIAPVEKALSNIVKKMESLNSKKTEVDVYDFPALIDETFPDDIEVFVNGRKRIAYGFGVDSYAAVMTAFAAGERYLNRVWSASVDGYQNEAHRYIEKSLTQFGDSLKTLKSLAK